MACASARKRPANARSVRKWETEKEVTTARREGERNDGVTGKKDKIE